MCSIKLARIVNNAMIHLHTAGLTVRCLVCDQSK